ncbi:MAG: hypothetical protein M3512_02520 [Bacteroidota bacterium]|nr:hypothetical protein [Bacteroidota bacterium]
MIINYPNQQLAILDTLPQFISENTSFVNCRVENGRIKVPFTINDTIQYLMYDTGASLFPIMTDDDHWKKMVSLTGNRDTITTSSWGEYYDVYGLEISVPLSLGDKELQSAKIYLNPRSDIKDFFQQEI